MAHVLAFGDVHGDVVALDRVLKNDTLHQCGQAICLGNLLGWIPCARQCLERAAQSRLACLQGQSEWALLHKECFSRISSAYRKELLALQQGEFDECCERHGLDFAREKVVDGVWFGSFGAHLTTIQGSLIEEEWAHVFGAFRERRAVTVGARHDGAPFVVRLGTEGVDLTRVDEKGEHRWTADVKVRELVVIPSLVMNRTEPERLWFAVVGNESVSFTSLEHDWSWARQELLRYGDAGRTVISAYYGRSAGDQI